MKHDRYKHGKELKVHMNMHGMIYLIPVQILTENMVHNLI